MSPRRLPLSAAIALACATPLAWSQAPAAGAVEGSLAPVTVRAPASADASAQGLSPAHPGGQVARGGRAGILGTRDTMETPFSITSYTNALIQDRQARSVGDVLQNDPGVRVARGFGNFQEAYFIRGFVLGSDDVAYNGLYSLLPRQYIATELFERVEVLRGASAFLTGANPGGGGLGGGINLLPKRAPDEPINRVTVGAASGGQTQLAADIARRFGPDGATGVRVNVARRAGGTAIDREDSELGLAAVGVDWRSRDVRLSADLGYQDNRLRAIRPNVTLAGTTTVPAAPPASSNWAQPWSYSNERDLFGTFRGEWDLTPELTAWGAYGARRSREANSLANLNVTDATTGAGNTARFDNTRKDSVDTGELGLRGRARTGSVGHSWVVAASHFRAETSNAYAFDFANSIATGLYRPTLTAQPALGPTALLGGNLAAPGLTGRTTLTSLAVGDTLSFAQDTVLLTLGLRHQRFDIESYAYGTGAPQPGYQASHTSPALGVVWKLAPQWSLYANAIEGLTQGERAPASAGGRPVVNAGVPLAPAVTEQREAGVKYDGGGLGGSLAAFTATRPRAFVDAAGVFAAAGEDRHRGVELQTWGQLVRGVKLLGGLTWIDAEQTRTGSAATDGRQVIGVPRQQATLGGEWEVRALPGLALDARVVHTGARYADDANTLRVPAWTRLDLGARYLTEVAGRMVTLRGRVDNATDRAYWSSVGGFPGAGYLVLGHPRTVTVSASVDF
jgi:iron complex outermembrane receptor protein